MTSLGNTFVQDGVIDLHFVIKKLETGKHNIKGAFRETYCRRFEGRKSVRTSEKNITLFGGVGGIIFKRSCIYSMILIKNRIGVLAGVKPNQALIGSSPNI